ncbi:hypothetical protein IFM89_001364 [Coptis chinensis]|uniref:CCHC-type domain-containing protein n=1 Tax=Coptis chinensis TaxID=261450 RepID=A0A835HJT6_9MAGN|nr:hypothetical protein IFM89_001364 [Coptis chinensis]
MWIIEVKNKSFECPKRRISVSTEKGKEHCKDSKKSQKVSRKKECTSSGMYKDYGGEIESEKEPYGPKRYKARDREREEEKHRVRAKEKFEEVSNALRQELPSTTVEGDENLVFGDDDKEFYKSLDKASELALKKQDYGATFDPQKFALLGLAIRDQSAGSQNPPFESKLVITEIEEFVWAIKLNKETHKREGKGDVMYMAEDKVLTSSDQETKDTLGCYREVIDISKGKNPVGEEEETVPDEMIEIFREVVVGKGLSGKEPHRDNLPPPIIVNRPPPSEREFKPKVDIPKFTEDRKVSWVATRLRGFALIWWTEFLQQCLCQNLGQVTTWEQSEEVRIHRYLHGFRGDIRYDLVHVRINTLEEAYSFASESEKKMSYFSSMSSYKVTPIGPKRIVKCYSCGQEAHVQVNCPKKPVLTIDMETSQLETIEEGQGYTTEGILTPADKGLPMLMAHVSPIVESTHGNVFQQSATLYNPLASKTCPAHVVLDNGSSISLISRLVVDTLGLSTMIHRRPKKVHSFRDRDFEELAETVRVGVHMGDFCDYVLCHGRRVFTLRNQPLHKMSSHQIVLAKVGNNAYLPPHHRSDWRSKKTFNS